MKIEVRNVTESNLHDVPGICKQCVYWSFPKEFEKTKGAHPKHRAKKKQWIIQTLREFGNCGKILYHNNVPVGYVECGPSNRFPQIKEHKSQPIGKIEDGVVFLSCLLIADKNLRGRGLGEKLLNSVITDLRKRGFKIKDETNPEFPIVKLDL